MVPDVFGGDVAPPERVHGPGVGEQQGLRLVAARVADDEALSAAEIEAGGGGLVGHRFREAEHVGEGVGLGRVGPHARPAEGRP